MVEAWSCSLRVLAACHSSYSETHVDFYFMVAVSLAIRLFLDLLRQTLSIGKLHGSHISVIINRTLANNKLFELICDARNNVKFFPCPIMFIYVNIVNIVRMLGPNGDTMTGHNGTSDLGVMKSQPKHCDI